MTRPIIFSISNNRIGNGFMRALSCNQVYFAVGPVAPEKYTAIYTVGGWMIALDKVNIINTLLAHK